MIFYLLIFYLLNESMAATNCTNDSTTDTYDMSKSIICDYIGVRSKGNPYFDDVDPESIPGGCGFIYFEEFSINQSSKIYVDQELLDKVKALNKPIILQLYRPEKYSGWTTILGSNGSETDAKVLCDFAKNNTIKGYSIFSIVPMNDGDVNPNVGKFIIPYLQQLKELCPSNFIIGLSIDVDPTILKNKQIYNFEELNKIVTYYALDTSGLNKECKPQLYNGLTPIKGTVCGKNYLYGLEEVVSNLKETKICLKKLVFDIPVYTINNNDGSSPSYTQMCQMEVDNSTWCIQTSQNLFDKGKYVHDLFAGIEVSLDWDDTGNKCKCQKAFNGFWNIYAGYANAEVLPCAMFDVQSTIYPIK